MRAIDVAIGEIRSFYERRGASTGAITFVQRFGSKINLNVHLPILFLDGACEAGPRGRPVFRPGPHVTDDDVGALVAAIAERVEQMSPPCDEAAHEDKPLALFQAASLQALGSRTAVRSARSSAPSASAVTSARSRASDALRAEARATPPRPAWKRRQASIPDAP